MEDKITFTNNGGEAEETEIMEDAIDTEVLEKTKHDFDANGKPTDQEQ